MCSIYTRVYFFYSFTYLSIHIIKLFSTSSCHESCFFVYVMCRAMVAANRLKILAVAIGRMLIFSSSDKRWHGWVILWFFNFNLMYVKFDPKKFQDMFKYIPIMYSCSYLSIYRSIDRSIYLSIYLPSIYLSIYLSIYIDR